MEPEYTLEDKVFNLQLHVNKLEQELSLYRKGTTMEDLLDVIGEKDKEISQLKGTLLQINDEYNALDGKLRILITEYKKLEAVKNAYGEEINNLSSKQNVNIEITEGLQREIEDMKSEKLALQKEVGELQSTIMKQSNAFSDAEVKIASLIEARTEQETSLETLVSKLASKQGEKTQLAKELAQFKKDHDSLITSYRSEIERGIQCNEDIKVKFRAEHDENKKLIEEIELLKTYIEKLKSTFKEKARGKQLHSNIQQHNIGEISRPCSNNSIANDAAHVHIHDDNEDDNTGTHDADRVTDGTAIGSKRVRFNPEIAPSTVVGGGGYSIAEKENSSNNKNNDKSNSNKLQINNNFEELVKVHNNAAMQLDLISDLGMLGGHIKTDVSTFPLPSDRNADENLIIDLTPIKGGSNALADALCFSVAASHAAAPTRTFGGFNNKNNNNHNNNNNNNLSARSVFPSMMPSSYLISQNKNKMDASEFNM